MPDEISIIEYSQLIDRVTKYKKDRSFKVLCPRCNSSVSIAISSYNNHAAVHCNNENCTMRYRE